MGGEFSGIRTEEDFLKEFEEIRRESDIHFGSVIIFRNKKNLKFNVLVKEKIILATDELTTFLEQGKLRSTIRAKNIAPLVEMFVHTDKKLCSTTYRAMVGFEFHERTLEKLLRQRKTYENEESQTMVEVDAWGVLSDLTAALRSYREKGINHGDVQPACVFVLNDKTLKLVDSCFMTDAASAFDRRYQDCCYKSPLSPQALTALTLGPKYATFDREKNDIWALGITMLVSLTNEDYNLFYDWHNQELNYDIILSRLRRVQTMGYSLEFIQALKLMLEKDENRRTNLAALSDFIARAPKPMYVSELQDLDGTFEDFSPQPVHQPLMSPPAMSPIQQPSYARQFSHRSNHHSQGGYSEAMYQTPYQSNLQTDVYGNPLQTEHNFPYKPAYEQRATAPLQYSKAFPGEVYRDLPQHMRRGQSPLSHRFGHSPNNVNGPQTSPHQYTSVNHQAVLRDIGNEKPWQQEEPRMQSPKGQKHRKHAMSHRNIASPFKDQYGARIDHNAWQQPQRYTHFN